MSHPHPQTYHVLRAQFMLATRSAKSALSITIALLFACVLMTIFSLAPSALAEELAPEALGSIAGVVRNAQGEPQSGIQVKLYQKGSYSQEWYSLRSVTIGPDGTYRFTLLPPNIYRIGVEDSKKNYAPIYYPAASTVNTGADIVVVGNQRTGIDIALQPGGRLQGNIASTELITISSITVELWQQISEYEDYWSEVQTTWISGTGGIYTFTGLIADNYRVCARGYSYGALLFECYDNVYQVSRATDLTITNGVTTSNVDLVLGDGADYAQLDGRVVSVINEPLADINVYLLPMPQPAPAPSLFPINELTMVPLYPYDWYWYGYPYYYDYFRARTDSLGNYHFPTLPRGTYALAFNDPNKQYATEYYDNAYVLSETVSISVTTNQIITGMNAQLELGGHISGTITIMGEPISSNFSFTVERKTPAGWQAVSVGSYANHNGQYGLSGLPAGVYRVGASGIIEDGYKGYEYHGYFGGETKENATEITLTSGAIQLADIALFGGPQFEGALSGRITANGAPLANAKVSLDSYDYLCCPQSRFSPQVYVFTDADGRYTINGLTTGYMQIQAMDPAGIYATTYYTAQAVPTLTNLVPVTDSEATTGIDIDLPLAGAISGRVTKRDGEAVAGLFVVVNLYTTNSGYDRIDTVSHETQTDADGRYTVKGLHAGDYYLCFAKWPTDYGECYGRLDLGYYYGEGKSGRVPVVAGATTPNIDLLWGPDIMSYFPVINR